MQSMVKGLCSSCRQQRHRLGEDGRCCFSCGTTEEPRQWNCDMCSNANAVASARCLVCGDGGGSGNLMEEYAGLKREAVNDAASSVVSKLEGGLVEDASVEYKQIVLGVYSYLFQSSRQALSDAVGIAAGDRRFEFQFQLFPGVHVTLCGGK